MLFKPKYLNYFTVHQMMTLVKDCGEGNRDKVFQALKYLSAVAPQEAADELMKKAPASLFEPSLNHL